MRGPILFINIQKNLKFNSKGKTKIETNELLPPLFIMEFG